MRLTRRGKMVTGTLLALTLWGMWQVAGHLWWTGTGLCWGSGWECLTP